MIKQYWGRLSGKIDGLSLRERVLIFAASAFLLVSLVNALFLDPLLAQQKKLSDQIVQQQEKMKEIQAQLSDLLQSKKDNETSPQRRHLDDLKRQLAEAEAYVQGRKDKLVPAEKMSELLEQVLKGNGNLQLVGLKTLPVTLLQETASGEKETGKAETTRAKVLLPEAAGKQVYQHGVQITVRGSYLDMLQYLVALEHLPSQMFWSRAQMHVVHYPVAELTLTVYTLSLDQTWLRM